MMVAFMPEFAVTLARADAPTDVDGHLGWTCWSAKNEIANLRVQVSARFGETSDRQYHLRIVTAPLLPHENPVVIASFDAARETRDSDRLIYEGSSHQDAAELRIHLEKRSPGGIISNLIYEREHAGLYPLIPIVSVIQLECVETRLP